MFILLLQQVLCLEPYPIAEGSSMHIKMGTSDCIASGILSYIVVVLVPGIKSYGDLDVVDDIIHPSLWLRWLSRRSKVGQLQLSYNFSTKMTRPTQHA